MSVSEAPRTEPRSAAVVLAEQPDLGLTIVEKLEHYGRACQFALILLTGDDETASGGLRARQNVIHELGYFHGILGRKRVLLLKEAGVELFSNISGLIYKEFPPGSLESVFEDIRLAVKSDDASPRFIREETERTQRYFGHIRPMRRLLPGLAWFEEEMRSAQQRTHDAFIEYWQSLDGRRLWSALPAALQSEGRI